MPTESLPTGPLTPQYTPEQMKLRPELLAFCPQPEAERLVAFAKANYSPTQLARFEETVLTGSLLGATDAITQVQNEYSCAQRLRPSKRDHTNFDDYIADRRRPQ